jgi:hypothetical protein
VTLKHALVEPGHRAAGGRRRLACAKGEDPATDGRWQDLIVRTFHRGIANGESDLEAVLEGMSPLAISSTEGTVMMSKLYGAPTRFTGL